jgi:hypothetical protein
MRVSESSRISSCILHLARYVSVYHFIISFEPFLMDLHETRYQHRATTRFASLFLTINDIKPAVVGTTDGSDAQFRVLKFCMLMDCKR